MSDFSGLPFAVGDVRGVRSWDVDPMGRLISPTYRTVWTPGEMAAECKKDQRDGLFGGLSLSLTAASVPGTLTRGEDGSYTITYGATTQPAPGDAVKEVTSPAHLQEKCGCGFYAYSNGKNDYAYAERLTGVIQGFGETQLGTRGFKCAKATILALHIPDKPKKVKARQVSSRSTHFERVAANYPDVQVFANYGDMLAAFPTYEHVPTPDTDPDFWTRGI